MLLFESPTQNDLNNWQKIKVLVSSLGIKDIEYGNTMPKESYIEIWFREVKIGIAPQQTHYLANDIQAQRKQYGSKQRMTRTIHAEIGDSLSIMATEISRDNSN